MAAFGPGQYLDRWSGRATAGGPLLRGVDLEDVGDTDLGDVLAVENPAGRARRGLGVLGVSRWCSGCRGDFGDRGAGGGPVGEGVPGGASGDEIRDAPGVDGSGQAAGGVLDQ